MLYKDKKIKYVNVVNISVNLQGAPKK